MNKIFLLAVVSFLLVGFGSQAFAQYDDKLVVLETNLGVIVMEFFPDDAPNHVDNFVELIESGFYDGTLFHRIIPGFMIQGGDPNTIDGDPSTWGLGGDDLIDSEYNTIKHKRGIVSMARANHIDSAGSQFFIVHKDKPNQTGLSDWTNLDELYTVFGRIVTDESFDTLDKIAAVETTRDTPNDIEQVRIIKTEVVNRSEISNLLELTEPERIVYDFEVTEYVDYQNEEFQFVMSHPLNWFIQEKQNPNDPVVYLNGQKAGLMSSIINVIIEEKGQKSFEDKINEYDTFFQKDVDSGKVEFISKEITEINGQKAYVTQRIQELRSPALIWDGIIKQVVLFDNEKFYVLTYYNDEKYFDKQLFVFDNLVDSFKILEKTNETSITSEENGGCLIATAAFGSEMAPQVQQLRELRDNTILKTGSGMAFMTSFNQFYYSFSPAVADLEREHPLFKEAVKMTLTPMLSTLSLLNYADIDSEEEMLGYGIGVILLNLGMYFVAPAIVIYKIRK